jgi:hypothetical protein
MIKGIDHYHHYLSLDNEGKDLFLINQFPSWFRFDYASREILFNAAAFVAWHGDAHFIEQDLWFRVLQTEQQKDVLKIWAEQLKQNLFLQNFRRETSSEMPTQASAYHNAKIRKH